MVKAELLREITADIEAAKARLRAEWCDAERRLNALSPREQVDAEVKALKWIAGARS